MDNDEDRRSTGVWAPVFRSFWGATLLFAILIVIAVGIGNAGDFGQPFVVSREEVLLTMLAMSSWLIGMAVRRLYRSTPNIIFGVLYGFLMTLCVAAVTAVGVLSAASDVVAFPREWQTLLHSNSFAEAVRNSFAYPWFVKNILVAVVLVVATIAVVYVNAFDVTKRR